MLVVLVAILKSWYETQSFTILDMFYKTPYVGEKGGSRDWNKMRFSAISVLVWRQRWTVNSPVHAAWQTRSALRVQDIIYWCVRIILFLGWKRCRLSTGHYKQWRPIGSIPNLLCILYILLILVCVLKTSFVVVIISRGAIQGYKSIKSNAGIISFQIPITANLANKFCLLAYYTDSCGALVADKTCAETTNVFQNNVKSS